MMRTASIRLDVTPEQMAALVAVRAAYADACNRLVAIVIEHRCWNRVALHKLAYTRLRNETPLGRKWLATRSFRYARHTGHKRNLGTSGKVRQCPQSVSKGSVHYDTRTYTIKGDTVSLNTLNGRIVVPLMLGQHQHRLLQGGALKEAELGFRKGKWFFNLVIESGDGEQVASGPVMGVDVGENNLAAIRLGKVFGGDQLRDKRARYLALRRRLQFNGSQSAIQKLRQVSGKEARRVKHVNHETSKGIVHAAVAAGVAKITMEDLTHIRTRIKAGKRVRGRLHRWAFRQLQTFVEYKASAAGIAVEYVNPAYTSQTYAECGGIGKRAKHRFE